MRLDLTVQYAVTAKGLPTEDQLRKWVMAALDQRGRAAAALTIRIVGEEEGCELNIRWRKANGPTNVLSFEYTGLEHIAPEFLGDIVLCAPIVAQEAHEQNKDPLAHWAHLVIHGTLHLLGFDHHEEADAEKMEHAETAILRSLGCPAPYRSTQTE